MPGLDDVLERLVNDPSFGALLRQQPEVALRGYQLTAADLDVLAATVAEAGESVPVEGRQSKSALLGFFAEATGTVEEVMASEPRSAGNPAVPPEPVHPPEPVRDLLPEGTYIAPDDGVPEGTYIEPGDETPEAVALPDMQPGDDLPEGTYITPDDGVPEGTYIEPGEEAPPRR